jgi:hypothetical protein
MDSNLIKIRDHNMHLIRRGKLAKPIVQAKSYLTHMLQHNWEQIDIEMDEFVAQCKAFIREKKVNHGQTTTVNG